MVTIVSMSGSYSDIPSANAFVVFIHMTLSNGSVVKVPAVWTRRDCGGRGWAPRWLRWLLGIPTPESTARMFQQLMDNWVTSASDVVEFMEQEKVDGR